MQLLNLLGELDNLLTIKYKGGPGSGRYPKGSGDGSSSIGFSIIGKVEGANIYKVERELPSQVLDKKGGSFSLMLSPKGEMFVWGGFTEHANVIDLLLNDGKNFDNYTRITLKKNYSDGKGVLNYVSEFSGVGGLGKSIDADIKAEKQLKKISNRLLNLRLSKDTTVEWYTSSGLVKSKLNDWV